MPTEIAIIGSGGHAKVVLDALAKSERGVSHCVFDEDPRRAGRFFMGMEVRLYDGDTSMFAESAHVAIGDNSARARISKGLASCGKLLHTVIHPGASAALGSEIGAGSFIAASAVIGPDARVGACVIVNHGAVVDHDCTVGDYAHIAPGAVLGGNVRVGEAALVGSGATVLPGVSIGDRAVVGAGAVVTSDVGPGETVTGAPAKALARD